MATPKYTFAQFKAQYPDDDACLDAIMRRHYGDKLTCPGCGVIGTTFHKITKRRGYACAQCGHHIFPCAGTIFEHSSTPLTVWFHCMYLMTATRNGVSAKEIQRQTGVTYKCAWRIGHQLRDLMSKRARAQNPGPLTGHVEIDETWIGGHRRRSDVSRFANKKIVMGMLQRGGPLKAKVVPSNKTMVLVPQVMENVAPGSTVNTDEWRSYQHLPALGYVHVALNHQSEEWARGIHHTNSIEGFWSHLKRGLVSTHVSVSAKHLQRYVDEFAFRYNNREAPAEMFSRMLRQITSRN